MRLIDAEYLKEHVFACATNGRPLHHMELSELFDAIDDVPTIEPERKTGKWIKQDDGWDGVYYECSVCKEAFTLIDGNPSDNLYNFCPNCGAKMKEGDQK